MNRAIYLATIGLALTSALSGCGGSSLNDVISTAKAQPAPAARPAPLDPETLRQLIAANPIGREGGALGRTGAAKGTDTVQSDGMAKATSFANSGWSYHVPVSCSSANVGGLTYLYLSFADGVYIYSADPNYVSLLSVACVASPLVAVNITANYGGFALWNTVFVYR